MRVLINKKLLPQVKELQNLVQLAELPKLPATLAEAAELLNSSPTPEIRQARKILLHGTLYGAGPQQLLEILKRH